LNVIAAQWQAVTGASSYEAQALDSAGQPLPTQPPVVYDAATASVDSSALQNGMTYQLRVRALVLPNRGPWSAPASATASVASLVAPQQLTLRNAGGKIAALWQAVGGADGYDVQVLDANGALLTTQPTVTFDNTSASIDAGALTQGAVYKVQARARAQNFLGPWCDPVAITRAFLAPPSNLALVNDVPAGLLRASWSQVTGASVYALQLSDASDKALPVSFTITGTTATAPSATLTSGSAYKVRVNASNQQATSDWSAPASIQYVIVAPPTITATSMQGNDLVATWGAVNGATRYNALVFDADGKQLGAQPPITYSGTTAKADATNLPVGAYSFKVQAIGDSFISPYSALASVVRAPTTPPAGFLAVYAADSVFASWQPYSGVNTFRLLFLDSQGQALQTQPDVQYSGTTAVADVSTLAPGSYSVKLGTVYAGKDGAYTNPVAFTVPGGWTQVSTAGPRLMTNPVILSYKGQLWAMAGQYQNTVYNSPDGRAWTQVSGGAPWVGRRSAAGLVYLGKMWLMGGDGGSGDKNDVWWSQDGQTWTQATASAQWGPRFGLCAVVFQGKMWVFGGMDHRGNVYNDVWSSTDGATWTRATAGAAWSKRDSATAAVFNGRVWIMGGSYGGNSIQDVWSTADGVNWQQAAAPPWSSRFDAGSAVARGSLYLLGGINTQTREVYDTWVTTDGQSWTQVESRGPWACSQMGVVAHANSVYVVGGLANRTDNLAVWAYQPAAPAGIGYSPVLVGSAADLVNNIVNLKVSTAGLSFGQFSASPSVVKATPDSGYYKILLKLGNAQPSYTVSNVVIGCSAVPLFEWNWYQNDSNFAGLASIWTSSGWKVLDRTTVKTSAAVPYRGLYFYRIVLKNVTMKQSLAAFLSSQNTAATVAFYTPPTHTPPSPIPAGFAPVVVNSAGALINELFNVNADNPQLKFGQYSAAVNTVMATPDSGYFKILFELGTSNIPYTVTNSVVACSDTPLSVWNWYQNAGSLAGTSSVWTNQGWQNIPPAGIGAAAAVQGLYFYRIDLSNVQVLGQLGAFLASQGKPATVAFFTRVGFGSP
jgi:hypothetical protein